MNRLGGRHALEWLLWLGVAGIAVFAVSQVGSRYRAAVPVTPPAASAEPLSVDLAVEQLRDVLVIRWNPLNPSVSMATHGLLSVTDGDFERKIGLNTRDLSSGMARYAPLSRHVSFQLSLYDGPVSGKGSVLFLARAPEPVAAQQPKKSVTKPGTKKQPPVTRAKEQRTRSRAEDSRVDERRAVSVPVAPPAPLKMEPAPPAAAVEMPSVTPPPVLSVPALPAPPAYRVIVTTQPSRGTRFEQVLNKLPWVKRIARAPSPALVEPVHRVDPQIEAPELTGPLEANVEIQVDSSGKVKTARLIDLDQAPGNLEWAALRAAKEWRFEAPQSGQSSWLVLTFRYEPAKAPRAE